MTGKTLPASTNVGPIEFRSTTRYVSVPVDFTIEDILRPGCWAHVAGKIQTRNEIVVMREDMAWRLHLLVTESGPGLVVAHILNKWINPNHREEVAVEEPADTPDAPENYTINHAPKTGWRVWTKTPPLEVSRNHKSRHEATLAAIAHAAKSNMVAA